MEKGSKKKLKRTRPEKEAVVETSKKAKIETGKIVTKVSEVEVKNKPLKKSKKSKVETSVKAETATEENSTKTTVKKVSKKKKWKGKKKKPAVDSEGTVVRLLEKPEVISCNWKNLLKTIEAEKATQKPKQNPSIFFSAARKKKLNMDKIMTARTEKIKSGKVPEKPAKKPEIWFDDVDECLLDVEDRPGLGSSDQPDSKSAENSLVKEGSFKGPTRIIGMDCEMVGVGFGGKDSILARVSIVNHFGHCIYDKYVKPREKVTDYRTAVSGIRPKDIENGEDFKVVQKEVSDLLQNRILVGHALKHDMKVLFLDHPRKLIRDTSTYKYFRNSFGGKTPSLKRLSERMLGVKVQEGEHSSVQDAQAAVRLYTMFRKEWELDIKNRAIKKKTGTDISAEKNEVLSHSSENVAKLNLPPTKTVSTLKKPAQKKITRPLYTDSD